MNRFKSIIKSCLILLTATLIYSSCETVEPALEAPVVEDLAIQEVEDSYIVVYRPGAITGMRADMTHVEKMEMVLRESSDLLRRLDINSPVDRVYGTALQGINIRITDASKLERLRTDPRVAYIEKDKVISLAPPPGKGPNKDDGGGSSGQETPWGISRVNGGVTYTGSGTAWVIDSGIDLDHPDLNVDVARSASFLGGRDADDPDDANGHGTHVAGTIAAIDNSEGVIGVAAGATVVSVRVLDRRGSGSYSGVIAGIDYVAAMGSNGDVANMSLGGGTSDAVDDAVKAAAATGVKFVIAAGNSGADANNYSPARANGNNIFTISASDINDVFASFSNYGNPPIEYAAPGVGVLSTYKNGGYNTLNGTSMAAPHAAGVLLLGNASSSGTVTGDPDGNPDPIITH